MPLCFKLTEIRIIIQKQHDSIFLYNTKQYISCFEFYKFMHTKM